MIGMQLALLLSHEHHELRAVPENPVQFGKDGNGHNVGIAALKAAKTQWMPTRHTTQLKWEQIKSSYLCQGWVLSASWEV